MNVTTSFSDEQVFVLVVLERVGGCLSLFSVILVFIFYGLFKRLRTAANTFIVLASIANVGASISSIIAYDGIYQGQPSTLCQAQGFLFEMFVQSDPWWSLAMAINVFLVFFLGASPQTFRRWGWLYCVVCYGGPLIIAIVCLKLRDPSKGLVYGSAGIWCWISNDWNPLRIYTYYALIWICIISTAVVYGCVGYSVFRARRGVQQLTNSHAYGKRTLLNGSAPRDSKTVRSADFSMASHRPKPSLAGSVEIITEVQVTTSPSDSAPASPASLVAPLAPSALQTPPRAIYATDRWHSPAHAEEPEPAGRHHHIAAHLRSSGTHTVTVTSPAPGQHRKKPSLAHAVLSKVGMLDPVTRAYLRTSLLFAVSVLVTWIPSSVNRIRGLIYSDSPYAYNVATASVLPLQGVWNGIIFFVTSWDAVRECIAQGWAGWRREWRRSRWEKREQKKERLVAALRRDHKDERGFPPEWADKEMDGGLDRREKGGGVIPYLEDNRRTLAAKYERTADPWRLNTHGDARGGWDSEEEFRKP